MLVVVTPLSGLAWNIESLIGFRVAAGVANGVATAAGTAMVLLAFPIATRSRAIGWYQSALSGAPAIGLIVGGQIVEQFGWRWVFAFFGVIAVIGLVTSATVVRPMGGGLDVSVDYWGGLTLTAGVALVLVGLTLLGNDGRGHFGERHPHGRRGCVSGGVRPHRTARARADHQHGLPAKAQLLHPHLGGHSGQLLVHGRAGGDPVPVHRAVGVGPGGGHPVAGGAADHVQLVRLCRGLHPPPAWGPV